MTLVDCKKHIAEIRWILFGVILMQIIGEYVVLTIASFIPLYIHEYILMGVKELLTFLPPLLMFVGKRKNPTLSTPKIEYRLNKLSIFNTIVISFMAIGGQFIMMLLNVPMNMLTELVFHKTVESSVPLAQSGAEILTGIIFMAILPSILEEFWMRGIVFGAFANYSNRAALIFTTLIFALLHAKMSQVLGILFLGYMTGYVLVKTNSLIAPIIYHIFSNTAALFAGKYLGEIMTAKGFYTLFGVFIVIFIFSLFIFTATNRRFKIKKGKYDFSLAIGSLFCLPVLLSIIMVVVNGYIYNLI